jgi:hypothetical protein
LRLPIGSRTVNGVTYFNTSVSHLALFYMLF